MGDHDAPSGWLDQWRSQEPLRLYLWTVAGAVLLGGVSVGLWTETWALAVGGVLAAVLMFGGTTLARREAFAPATVERLLDRQHASSYTRGHQEALLQVEAAAARSGRPLAEALTEELHAVHPETAPRQSAGRCQFVESGRRCLLPRHPGAVGHRLEEARPRE